jgi:hypothetical protein
MLKIIKIKSIYKKITTYTKIWNNSPIQFHSLVITQNQLELFLKPSSALPLPQLERECLCNTPFSPDGAHSLAVSCCKQWIGQASIAGHNHIVEGISNRQLLLD